MFDLRLSPEQIEIRDAVREFVAGEVKPAALASARLEAFERPLLTEQLDQASRMGLRTLALPEDAGGAGADNLTCCIVTEELAAGDPDIAAVLAHTAALAGKLEQVMTPAQRGHFLPQFLEDDRFHLSLAEREPESQTALGIGYHRPRPKTRAGTLARRSGSEWAIDGVKTAVANAPVAQLFVVRADAGTLLVPRDAPGVSVREQAGHWYHGACGEVTFSNCRVPAENLVGAEIGVGSIPLLQAIALGIGRAAYEAALDYAKLRVQGGRRIIEHQAIGAKLAEIAVWLEVARAAVWRAAWAADHPEAVAGRSLPDLPLQTIAEVFTSEAILKSVKEAAECFGAMGVMRDMPLHKYVQDARICLHSGDGNADAKLRLAEALAGYRT